MINSLTDHSITLGLKNIAIVCALGRLEGICLHAAYKMMIDGPLPLSVGFEAFMCITFSLLFPIMCR